MIVEMLMVVKAYSPYDPIDAVYRNANPIPITARGNDCRHHPYGIAGYLPNFPKGTVISVPGYRNNTPTPVDDTGGYIRKAAREKKPLWIEVRFPTHKEALKWGNKTLLVRITYP